VRTTIIALSAAAVIAAAPGVLAQNVSNKTPDKQHHASKKHPPVSVYAPERAMHAKGFKTGYPGTSGYTPSEPKDYVYENSRYGGGGGGGGGGGSGM